MQSRSPHGTPLGRLARFAFRRRKYVIIAWIVALVLLVPVLSSVGKYESLQQGSVVGNKLESVTAADLISAQFKKSVANTTLLIVVSGSNVSSAATQTLISRIGSGLKSDPRVVGLNQTLDVFSPLYATIKGINERTYGALDQANQTGQLLLGVPALYLQAWNQTYASDHNSTTANRVAYNTVNSTLPNSIARQALSVFYSVWSAKCMDPATAVACATDSARSADIQLIARAPPSSRPLAKAVVEYFTLTEFASPHHAPSPAELSNFAADYESNRTAYSQRFVNSTFSLGRAYDNASLHSLAGNIVWNPGAYRLDPGLSSLISSLVSPSRDTTLISLGLNRSADSNLLAIRSTVQSTFASMNSGSGLTSALVTGQDAISYDFGQSTTSDLGLILPVTIILLIVATGLFFRSVLTPFITLGTIGLALGISQAFIVLVGIFVAKVDFTVPTILLTVLIGVGTDYSVFVTARYREERTKGESVQEAVETSVTWAGESIVTSGATVIISFLSLAATSIVFLRTMGLVVGLGVLVALSVALTLVPAVLGIVGGRAFWPLSGARFERYSASSLLKLRTKSGYFSRSGAFAVKRAKVLIIIAVLVTLPAVYVYATTTPTFDFVSAAPSSLESISASNQLTHSFGASTLSPTYVVLTFAQPLVSSHAFDPGEMEILRSVTSYLAGSPDVGNVTGPTSPYGNPVNYGSLNVSNPSDSRTFHQILGSVGRDNKTALLTIDFQRGFDPYSSAAIADAQSIRNYLHANFDSAPGVTGIYVGGASGSILDTRNVFDSNFNSIVPIVAVGVALVLLVVLGSLFLPIFAVLSVLMSIVWTLGATKFVFQQYFNFQILFITPFFLFVTLLGLGMDYNVFILTRIREEATKGKHLNDAIISAIEQTGGIITAAAIILAGSLGALMLSSDLFLKQLGFAFAYSILIDALVVRTYLVPAVMSVMGRWNWFSPIPYLNRSKALFEKDTDAPPQA